MVGDFWYKKSFSNEGYIMVIFILVNLFWLSRLIDKSWSGIKKVLYVVIRKVIIFF